MLSSSENNILICPVNDLIRLIPKNVQHDKERTPIVGKNMCWKFYFWNLSLAY